MLLTLRCPRCQKKLQVPSKMIGQTLSCPSCNTRFTAKVFATTAGHEQKRPAGEKPPDAAAPPLATSPPAAAPLPAAGPSPRPRIGYVQCPRCQKRTVDTGKLAGRFIRCPDCGWQLKMPGKPPAPARPQPAPAGPARTQPAPTGPARLQPAPAERPAAQNGHRPASLRAANGTKPASRPSPGSNGATVRRRGKSKAWRWGIIGATGLFAVWFLFPGRRQGEREFPSAANIPEGGPAAPIDDTTFANIKPARPSTEEESPASWSTYHSKQGGFSVDLPDQREEKQYVQLESLGLEGPGVEARFVQLPKTSDPIESWPAIGGVWLRAVWVESSDLGSSSPAARVPAGATTVLVGDLSGKEFVVKKGNETQKVRLFVDGHRTIVLAATFVGRESEDDRGSPFGEGVDRFLDSLRLDSPDVSEVPASVTGETASGPVASDSFAIVERYVRELAGNELSEDLIRRRVADLAAAAAKARASPEEVLNLLRTAKAEAEATGANPVFVIRTVLGRLDFKATVQGNR